MSDIILETISAPELGASTYGANIREKFNNINANFTQIVEGEYLKGQSGDIVMLEEIDLTPAENQNHEIHVAFHAFINTLGVGDNNGIGDINSSKLYMIYILNQETREKIYKTSLPYTFLDPRFNPVSNSTKNENLEDKSCIIIYDGDAGETEETGETEEVGEFKSYKAFPNIYFNGDQNEFCWKINGLQTPLLARGPRGETGYAGSFYVLKAEPSNTEDGYYKVSFIITPNDRKEYLGVIKGDDLVSKLENQGAFVYHENGGYLTTIERHQEGNEVYAVCRLDPSSNVYNIFSGESLVDTLISNTVEDNGYGSLFLPVKEKSNEEVLAHTLTTKLAGDRVGVDQDYHNTTKKEDLVLSPGIFKKTSVNGEIGWQRTLGHLTAEAARCVFINNYRESKFPYRTHFGTTITDNAFFKNITSTDNASFNKTETNEATISQSLISSNLCKNKNNIIKPWIELITSSTSFYVFPKSSVNNINKINELYANGVSFILKFSIGELEDEFTFVKSNDTGNGYDAMLEAVKTNFKDFIEDCKESDPSNPSYQWNPEVVKDNTQVKLSYDGDFFELQDPKELIIKVKADNEELLNFSYNPKLISQTNNIKINGNVKIPGIVQTSDLLIGNQTLNNRIDNRIVETTQSLLEEYFAETNAHNGGTSISNNDENMHGEQFTILPGYRHPIQIWESVYFLSPELRVYMSTFGSNKIPPIYLIKIDLTGAQSYISCLRFKTSFVLSGLKNGEPISITFEIKDLNGVTTTWSKSRSSNVNSVEVDATITFKNNQVSVPGFTQVQS